MLLRHEWIEINLSERLTLDSNLAYEKVLIRFWEFREFFGEKMKFFFKIVENYLRELMPNFSESSL